MKKGAFFDNPFFRGIGKALNMLDQAILKMEEFILSASVIVISLMICGNVISRELFGPSIYFHAEVAQFAIIIATFMGISYGARKGRHISMSAIYDSVPFKFRKFMAILIPLGTAIALFVLAYVSFQYVQNAYERGTTTTSLRVPIYLMYMFLPIGFLLGAIQYVRNMLVNIFNKEVYIGTDALDYNDIEPEKRELDDNLQV
ncbi:TRAP transporter small permease [Halalkalibacillus sediminis]|uniref:TRAP transporter small permease n=1 Tax=Halalkalibacillus sediminis TaxID=2018042 RepID=A0A2I0QS80_9BACI|nr:TRAP transporter small permease [Halalkalibacillus sediminis]PKR77191.1 TRAP transporter small permease [Halalkalibacillus sediminis]